jgi:hypothetical protein
MAGNDIDHDSNNKGNKKVGSVGSNKSNVVSNCAEDGKHDT